MASDAIHDCPWRETEWAYDCPFYGQGVCMDTPCHGPDEKRLDEQEEEVTMRETVNMRVTQAGYKYIGHYRKGYLEIVLEGGGLGVSITPKNEFDMFDLFLCFGIDPEDGKWMNELVGKYCRVQFYDNSRVKMIQHIVNDEVWWAYGKSEKEEP